MGLTIDVPYIKAELQKYFSTPKWVELVEKLKTGGVKFSVILALIWEGVIIVEKIADDAGEVGAGAAKKEALMSFLDEAIDLPFYLEWIDNKVIGLVVDGLITFYNVKNGKRWIDTLKNLI